MYYRCTADAAVFFFRTRSRDVQEGGGGVVHAMIDVPQTASLYSIAYSIQYISTDYQRYPIYSISRVQYIKLYSIK